LPSAIENFDLIVSNAMRSTENPVLTLFAHVLTAITYAGLLWALLAGFLWWRGHKLLAQQIALALIIGAIEMAILKHLFHRERPITITLYEFWMPLHKLFADRYSFPSGHTVLSFAAAFVLLKSDRDWRGWLAIAVAFVVGLCRIYEGMHWPTDVIAGIFFGLLAAAASIPLARKLSR
jgi:undecaprenyl-diphosphatase